MNPFFLDGLYAHVEIAGAGERHREAYEADYAEFITRYGTTANDGGRLANRKPPQGRFF
jgi:hypothetical protein